MIFLNDSSKQQQQQQQQQQEQQQQQQHQRGHGDSIDRRRRRGDAVGAGEGGESKREEIFPGNDEKQQQSKTMTIVSVYQQQKVKGEKESFISDYGCNSRIMRNAAAKRVLMMMMIVMIYAILSSAMGLELLLRELHGNEMMAGWFHLGSLPNQNIHFNNNSRNESINFNNDKNNNINKENHGELDDELNLHVMVDRMFQLSNNERQHPIDGSDTNNDDYNSNNKNNTWPRCALNFYGLPRAFSRIVLPSIVRNILIPNARYQCDIYVNFHALTQEASGRSGHGGSLDLDSVHLIRQAVHRVHEKFQQQQQQRKWTHKQQPSSTGSPPPPRVVITNFTTPEFERQRRDALSMIPTSSGHSPRQNTNQTLFKVRHGFPMQTNYNILCMYHALQGVWDLMTTSTTTSSPPPRIEKTVQQAQLQDSSPYYQRVAIFRIDVFYATPIDIFHYSNRSVGLPTTTTEKTKKQKATTTEATTTTAKKATATKTTTTKTKLEGKVYDVDNRVAVIPGFARFPVNDRMMYGPYDAVKVYASRRFELLPRLIEKKVKLHSETFLQRIVFPEIFQLHKANSTTTTTSSWQSSSEPQHRLPLSIYEDDNICFVRARADESVWINDCTRGVGQTTQAGAGGEVRSKNSIVRETMTQLQQVVGGRCTKRKLNRQISPNITAFGGVQQATCQ